MNDICARTSDHIDRATRSATRFCRKAIVDYLKFLHDFGGDCRSTRACELVVVVQAIDQDIVALWPQAAEDETTASQRCRVCRCGYFWRTRNIGSKKHKVEIIAASYWQLFYPLLIH